MVCENITITNCVLHSRDSALKIGTETHGTIRNVTLSDIIDPLLPCGGYLGTRWRNGGGYPYSPLTGSTLRYADRYAEPGAPGWWGKTNRFSSVRPPGKTPDKDRNHPNVTFDNLSITAESCGSWPVSRKAACGISASGTCT